MEKFYPTSKLFSFPKLFLLSGFLFYCLAATSQTVTLNPSDDAYTRDGNYGDTNYGSEPALILKAATSGFTRHVYLKFDLTGYKSVKNARLRIYGSNANNSNAIPVSAYGVYNDSWSESVITFNNEPPAEATGLSTVDINNAAAYHDLDITDFVNSRLLGNTAISVAVKAKPGSNTTITLSSKEGGHTPELVIDTTASISNLPPGRSYGMLFVENQDVIPANDQFTFSRIQIPWTRGTLYNGNHDSLRIRLHNNGLKTLVINDLAISAPDHFIIDKLNGVAFNPANQLPLAIASGKYLDLIIKFIAKDLATRVAVVVDNLVIKSNDDNVPEKVVTLHGLWQYSGEGIHEPYSREIIEAFNFLSAIGYGATDPHKGDNSHLKGDEIKPYYFIKGDNAYPVTVTQLAAYHNCCQNVETFRYFEKGSSNHISVFSHNGKDAQTLLPRLLNSSSLVPASGAFTTTNPFGIVIGNYNTTVPSINPGKRLGTRVYKAIDQNGNIVPYTFILTSDYLGNESTNFDYNDNVYLIQNVRPFAGTAYFSPLNTRPSAGDYHEVEVGGNAAQQITLINAGQSYPDQSVDPPFTISSIEITGENKSEFSVQMPAKTTLAPGDSTTIAVNFKPQLQGLRVADLLIHYTNSSTPKRVPLYGIAKASGVTVTNHYRINAGAASPVTINGQTWAADNKYAKDNLEPFTNNKINDVDGTDDDILFTTEQSSDKDKAPFRYALPLPNGKYQVRLRFAEIYWGAPGSGYKGGEGSRVFHIQMENQYALVNFDLAQQAGGPMKTIIKNFVVDVQDSILHIDFSATVNRPMVSALEVFSFSSDTTAITGPPVTDNDNDSDIVRVFPNPTRTSNIKIHFPATYKGIYGIQLYDVVGRRAYNGQLQLNGIGYTHLLDVGTSALRGMYFMKIISPARKSEVFKILIER